jgi:hypothetical protein
MCSSHLCTTPAQLVLDSTRSRRRCEQSCWRRCGATQPWPAATCPPRPPSARRGASAAAAPGVCHMQARVFSEQYYFSRRGAVEQSRRAICWFSMPGSHRAQDCLLCQGRQRGAAGGQRGRRAGGVPGARRRGRRGRRGWRGRCASSGSCACAGQRRCRGGYGRGGHHRVAGRRAEAALSKVWGGARCGVMLLPLHKAQQYLSLKPTAATHTQGL